MRRELPVADLDSLWHKEGAASSRSRQSVTEGKDVGWGGGGVGCILIIQRTGLDMLLRISSVYTIERYFFTIKLGSAEKLNRFI